MDKDKGDIFFSTESADITDHRKTDDEILASEEKYRAFFATSIDCVFITTLDGKWVDFNDAAIGLFGYDSREELMNVKIIDLYANPADRKDHIRNIREKGYSFEYPVNLRKKDGTIISTLITSVVRKDKEGNIIGFQGTVRDITEKKAAEDRISELLRIQDEQLRIINTSPAVAFLWRAEENWPVEMVSNNITQFGYTVDDFISGRVVYSTIIHPDDFERVASEVEYHGIHNIDEFSQVYRIFGKGKKEYWIDDYTHIRRDTTGRITHYEGIILDISDRRRAEEALKESEEKFRGVSERSSDLIMLTDEQGRITYIAPSVSRILGYDPDEFIGKAPGELVHPDDLHIIYGYLGQYAEGQGGETNFEARVRKKDNSYAILEFSGTPILKEGLYSGVQVVARDITQRRRTEEALNASEKRNRDRLEALLRLAEMESASKQELMDFVLDASCRLTESQFAFIGTMNPDETVFDIASWSKTVMEDCSVAASPIHYPIEKAGIWAEAVRRREPFTVNDYQLPLPGKKGIPPGHVPIRRFVSIPIFEGHRIVMVAAVANKETPYDKTDVNNLVLLMQGVWNHLRKSLAEEALRESEQKYRTLSEESPDQIFIIDRNDIVRYVNSTALRLLHLSLDQVIGKPRQILFPKEIDAQQEIYLKKVFESGKPLHQEGTIIFGDTTLSIDSNLVPLKDKDGNVTAIMGISRDITHLKRTEEALRESRQILEAILNSITVRVFWKDRNLVYLGCNTPFARDAGFENSGDIIGKDDYAMGWREQAELYRADDRTVIESGKEKLLFEEPQTTPTGEMIYLLTSKVPLRNANNEIIGILGTYLDITDRKRAEDALQAAVELINLIDTLSVSECMSFTLDEAERLTTSRIGFFHFVNEGEQTIQLVAWSTDTSKHCMISKEPERHYPLSQAGVWVDCIRERRPVIHNDYASLPYKKGLPEGHVQVIRELVVPIFDEDKIVAIIGVGNKATDYNERDITILTLLAKNTWTLIRRKKAEDALKESEQKFREIFDNANDAIEIIELLDSGLPGRYLDLNDVACRMVLYSKEELLQLSPLKITTEYFSRPFNEIIEELHAVGHVTFETEHRRKDGIIVPVEINTHKITLLGRTVLLSIARNISERKKAEEALKESEYRFRELFNSMNSGVAVCRAVDNGADFIFIDFNHGAEIIEQKKKEEVTGKRVTDVFPGIHEFGLLEVFQRVWRTGQSEHYPLALYKDEQITSWRENYVYRLPSGEIVAIYDDVTDRQHAEEALKMSENRYRTLFEDSPISLWEEDFSDLKNWTDKKRQEGVEDLSAYFSEHPEDLTQCIRMVKVIHINRATMSLFGVDSFQEFNKGLSTIFSKESLDAFKEEMIALCNGETEFEKEVPLMTVHGDRKMIIMKVTVVPGYEKTFSRIFVSGIDITERKSVEKALHQANKKLNMLSSITRHDILNMIMVIRGYLELSGDLVENPELKEYMKMENDAVDSIQRQIEFTRYYQDIGVEEPRWQDPGEIVVKVSHQLKLTGITLENSMRGIEIFADPLIEKVFYNLIENSLRHGKHVTKIRFTYTDTGTGLIITYSDNGVGITKADKEKLFQKGFGKHTGLGLFLSREILSITGITIHEDGEPGIGAIFKISVPEDGYRPKDNT